MLQDIKYYEKAIEKTKEKLKDAKTPYEKRTYRNKIGELEKKKALLEKY